MFQMSTVYVVERGRVSPRPLLYGDEVSRKRTKSGIEDKTDGKGKIGEHEFTGKPPYRPWGDYAEELIPPLLVGRRSETDPGWLEICRCC